MKRIETLGRALRGLGLDVVIGSEKGSYREGFSADLERALLEESAKVWVGSEGGWEEVERALENFFRGKGFRLEGWGKCRRVWSKEGERWVVKVVRSLREDCLAESRKDWEGGRGGSKIFAKVFRGGGLKNRDGEFLFPVWIIQEKIKPMESVGEIGDYFGLGRFGGIDEEGYLILESGIEYILNREGVENLLNYSGENQELLDKKGDLEGNIRALKRRGYASLQEFGEDLKKNKKFMNFFGQLADFNVSYMDLGAENMGWDNDGNLVIIDAGS